MGTSVWRQVRGDLRRIALGVTGVPDLAFEGRRFTPTTGIAWVREAIEKGTALPATLGSAGMVEERGIYMLDLNWPATASEAEGEDLADHIRLAYYPGRAIESSGPDFIKGGVLQSRSLRTAVFTDWTVFPIRIEFFVRRAMRQGWPT